MFTDWLARILKAVCVNKDQCSLTELQAAVNVVALDSKVDTIGLRAALIKLGFIVDDAEVVYGLRPLMRSDLPSPIDLRLTRSPARRRYLVEALGYADE